MVFVLLIVFFFVKQKTSYEMRISDWSSDVCSSDLRVTTVVEPEFGVGGRQALVKLRLRSGRVLRHRQEEPKGEPTSQLSRSEERRGGQSVSVRVDLGGRRIITKQNNKRSDRYKTHRK